MLKLDKAAFLLLLGILDLVASDQFHFSYDRCSAHGPRTLNWWGPACRGQENSPIDVCGAEPFPSDLPAPKIEFRERWDEILPMGIGNNGHSIGIGYANPLRGGAQPVTYAGNLHYIVGRSDNNSAHEWLLEQAHIHVGRHGHTDEGSEHYLQGKAYPMEMHMVHYNVNYGRNVNEAAKSGNPDALLVIGIMFEIGDTEPQVLQSMRKNVANPPWVVPTPTGGRQPADFPFNWTSITSQLSGEYYAYKGGLTTPGCFEIVTWVNMETVLTVTEETLNVFKSATLNPTNIWEVRTLGTFGTFRPLQERNGRKVYTTSGNLTPCNTPKPTYVCRNVYRIHDDDPTELVAYVGMALAVGALVYTLLEYVPRSLRFPYTMCMFLLGFAMEPWAAAAATWGGPNGNFAPYLGNFEGQSDRMSNALRKVVSMNPEIILMILVPPLLFSAALEISPHVLKKQFGKAFWLAVPGVLIGTVVTACLVKACFTSYDWSWTACFMFAGAVSATDPVAVVALLSELGASESFRVLIDGEALLNDASAAVLFQVFRMFARDDPNLTAGNAISQIFCLTLGSVAVGLAFGIATCFFLWISFDKPAVEIGLTFGMTYLCFWTAQFGGMMGSGILATVTFALFFCVHGTGRVSSHTAPALHFVWETVAWMANTVLFFLVGTLVFTRINGDNLIEGSNNWGYAFLLYLFVHLSRLITIGSSWPILRLGTYRINREQATLLWFSGLRGVITLCLGLLVLFDPIFDATMRDQIVFQIATLVFFTLLINGPAASWLYVWLGQALYTEGQKQIGTMLAGQIELLVKKRREELKKLSMFRKADVNHHFETMPELQKKLSYADQPKVNTMIEKCRPKCCGPKYDDANLTTRECWIMVLRAACNQYGIMFNNGLLSGDLQRLLVDLTHAAEDQPGDLSGSLHLQYNLLAKNIGNYKYKCFAGVPLLKNLHLADTFDKVRLAMQIIPAFLWAFSEALHGFKAFSISEETSATVKQMQDEYNTVEESMKALYYETLAYHPELYPLGREYLFSVYDLHFVKDLVEHLGDSGVIANSEVHEVVNVVRSKEHHLYDHMTIKVLRGAHLEATVDPASELPFPPSYAEIKHAIASADQQIYMEQSPDEKDGPVSPRRFRVPRSRGDQVQPSGIASSNPSFAGASRTGELADGRMREGTWAHEPLLEEGTVDAITDLNVSFAMYNASFARRVNDAAPSWNASFAGRSNASEAGMQHTNGKTSPGHEARIDMISPRKCSE